MSEPAVIEGSIIDNKMKIILCNSLGRGKFIKRKISGNVIARVGYDGNFYWIQA